MDKKTKEFEDEQIKENCVIEFLCLLKDKPEFSLKNIIEKIKNLFRR